MKNTPNGGVMANSINISRHSGNLVLVEYMDPILFRNTNPKLYENPNIRETVGWIINEDDESIQINWDRSLKPPPYERTCPKDSGLTIPKNCILKMKNLISSPLIDTIRKNRKNKVEDIADH